MEWQDDGIIIGGRRQGETSLVLEVMTRTHGRHLGLVRGGRSKRMQPLLQPGNSVVVTWRARLEEHLGLFTIETTRVRAAALMSEAATLQGLNLVTGLLRLLAEREAHETLFLLAEALVEGLDDPEGAPRGLVEFELAVLAESGFGLDLERCAATGSREDLIFVSPKSARAVSRLAGAPYADRLLPLPRFLRGERVNRVPLSDIRDGFALAAHFLARDLLGPRGLALPEAHHAYVTLISQREQRESG